MMTGPGRINWRRVRLGRVILLILAALALSAFAVEFLDTAKTPAKAPAPRTAVVEPGRNAYFTMIGLNAPAGTDPFNAGLGLLEAYLTRAGAWTSPPELPSGGGNATSPGRPLEPLTSHELPAWLEPGEAKMTETLKAYPALVAHLTDENIELLARYNTLTGHPDFAEPAPGDPDAPQLDYNKLRAVQNLWFMQTFNSFRRFDTQYGLDLLLRDIRLWRMVLVRSRTAVSKMVALGLLRRDLLFLGEIAALRPLTPRQFDQAREGAAGLSAAELSFAACIAAEVELQRSLLRRLSEDFDYGVRVLGPLRATLLHPFFGMNKAMQVITEELKAADRLAGIPGGEFHQAYADIRFRRVWPGFGRIGAGRVRSATLPDYAALAYTVRSVDGVSRLVRLRLELLAASVREEAIPAYLRNAPAALRDPFSARPARFDESEAYIYFYDPSAPDSRSGVTRVYLR